MVTLKMPNRFRDNTRENEWVEFINAAFLSKEVFLYGCLCTVPNDQY